MTGRYESGKMTICLIIPMTLLTAGLFSGCGLKAKSDTEPTQTLNAQAEIVSTAAGIDDKTTGTDGKNAGKNVGKNAGKNAGKNGTADISDEKVPKTSEPEMKSTPISEEEMEALLDTVITETDVDASDVRCCAIDDFNEDGKYEGVVYVGAGPDDEFGWCEGAVYYVSGEKCKKIYDGTLTMTNGNVFRVVDAGSRKFIIFNEAYVTAEVSYVYYIDESGLKESNISRFGDINSATDLQNIQMSFSTYDGFCTYTEGEEDSSEWTGHTWKPYYFYYDSDKKDFMEYGGKEITAKELEKIVGFDLALEIEKEGYQVDNILYRKNGIVNVNYSKEEELAGTIDVTYKNVTYDENTGTFIDAWDTGGDTWQDSDFGGIYMNALNPEMAEY